MSDAGPLLAIDGLVKLREQAGSRFELQVPDLRLVPGEFVAVVGESGCGKSTLLDLLALISRPSACVGFHLRAGPGPASDIAHLWDTDGERELAALRRRALGYVLQTGGLLPYLSVRDNLRLPSRINGLPGVDAEIERMAERIGVADCLAKRPQRLSGGQRQRVAILRALLHRPALVLADEPTAAVDQRRARGIVADLQALARDEGPAIVMVTHDLGLVEGIAGRRYGFTLEERSPQHTVSVCRGL